MLSTVVEHLLGLGKSPDQRADESLATSHETEGMNRSGLRRDTNEAHGPVAFQEGKVGIEVMICRNGIEDEVKGASRLGHFLWICREDHLIGTQAL